MRLLYEQELIPQLGRTDSEIIDYARDLVESNNARNWQMAGELSNMLRRNNRPEAAVEVAQMLFEKDPTVDKLNLYFVAVVDEGSIEKIRALHEKVEQYVKENNGEYQKHLFATWLKAANRIQDDTMFQYVYDNIPSSEKVQNSYIISQYYVYMNRHSRYQEVMDHYDKLAPNMQSSSFVRRYYLNASARLGYSRSNPGPYMDYEHEAPPKSPDSADGENAAPAEGKGKQVFLVYGNKPPELMTVKLVLSALHIQAVDIADNATGGTILEKFQRYADQSKFAIVLLTPADKVMPGDGQEKAVYHARQNVIFEWGYFLGSVGKENLAVLVSDMAVGPGKLDLPSDILGTELISMSSLTSNWVKKLAQRLKTSGFDVDLANLPI